MDCIDHVGGQEMHWNDERARKEWSGKVRIAETMTFKAQKVFPCSTIFQQVVTTRHTRSVRQDR